MLRRLPPLHAPDPPPAVEVLAPKSVLLRHCQGDFLPREAPLPCFTDLRDDLRQQWTTGLADLASILCHDGQHHQAKRYRGATAIAPCHQRVHRDRTICLQQQAELAEGPCVYQRSREVLGDRLGVQPSSVAEALCRTLRE